MIAKFRMEVLPMITADYRGERVSKIAKKVMT